MTSSPSGGGSGGELLRRVAPPVSVPLRHFALGAAAYAAFAVAFAFSASRLTDFGFEPRFALGLVHLLTLGWVAQNIFGVWAQMLPVHGDAPLGSVAAVKAAWGCLLLGLFAFIATLWSGGEGYWVAACLLLAAVLVYVWQYGSVLVRASRRDWSSTHFVAALAWLVALAFAGLAMAFDRHRGVLFLDPEGGLIAHVHMALLGFMTTTIFGAGYRLFPWVARQQQSSRREGRFAFALLQCGLIALSADALFGGRRFMPVWAWCLAAAYAAYLSQFRSILERSGEWDPSRVLVLLGLCSGLVWAALGLGLAHQAFAQVAAARAAYVYAALVGCATPIILSQIHKVAPFLVWLNAFSSAQRSTPGAPAFGDLTHDGLAWGECAGLLLAVPAGVAGFMVESEWLLRIAGFGLTVSAGCYLLNTIRTLGYLVKRRD